jgi:uncharacterized protein (DUF305 family)
MTGMRAYPQHSHSDSQAAWGDPAWSELEDSMQSMHEALFSLKSTGNNDEDFVRLMLPHHQAALDMAKAELMHGQDPQMRRLAQEIITEQESEIELMQLWLPASALTDCRLVEQYVFPAVDIVNAVPTASTCTHGR